jgi:NTE family protein
MKALVLGGGGVKGAYQCGALQKWMFEDGNDYDILCGTSVGAINAAFLAQTKLGDPKTAAQSLKAMWGRVNNDKIKKRWFPFGVFHALWEPSVYNSHPLQQWISSELKPSLIVASGRKVRVVAVSWDSGEAEVANETTPDLDKWVIGSSAFPVMLTPVEINGQLWTDGGLRNVTPLGEAIRAGATEIDVILCSNPWEKSPFPAKGNSAVPKLLLRAIDIISDQVSRADLQICGLKNDIAKLGRGEYREIKVRVLQPSTGLTPNSLDFDPIQIQEMITTGYVDACNWKPEPEWNGKTRSTTTLAKARGLQKVG